MVNDIAANGYSEKQGRALFGRLRESIPHLPGVESVSLTGMYPLGVDPPMSQIRIEGTTSSSEHGESVADGSVDGAYFSTLGIPLLAGRVFAASDTPKSPNVVVINRTMAEKYWPNQDPIGRTVQSEEDKSRATVIGVVGDTKTSDIDEAPRPFMYIDFDQNYQSGFMILVRTQGKSAQLLSALYDTIHKSDPEIGFNSETMDEVRDFALYIPRLALISISGFGGLAFVLAAVGLYGAVFYSVSERTREMGIRVALGAHPWDLWKLVLRQTSAITIIGLCVGIAGGVCASIVARSLLYRIQPVEWVVLTGVGVVMLAMTLATAYSAARPWMRVDPMQSVRHV
jgi:predicted permease